MKNKKIKIIQIACVVCIATFLILIFMNIFKDKADIIPKDEVLPVIEEYLPSRQAGIKEEKSSYEMPRFVYKNTDYVAALEIESKNVKLPVIARADKTALKQSPCLYGGNPYEGSVIIEGNKEDFRFAKSINKYDELLLTDMHGRIFKYEVAEIKHSKTIEDIILKSEGYDFTLFVSDKEEKKYISIHCATIV